MSQLPSKDTLHLQSRLVLLSSLVFFIFLIIISRLWYLQIIENRRLAELSENNRLRFVPIASARGTILDRNGIVLVGTNPSFSLAIVPQDVRNRVEITAELSSILGLSPEDISKKLDKFKWRAKYYPIVVASGITRDQVEFFEENRLRLPGITIEMKPIRSYPEKSLASHLLGYISEVSDDELSDKRFSDYNSGDYVGKSGIERNFESYLHGKDGGKQIEVDARGRYLKIISETSPTEGGSLFLTIDSEIQREAEKAFGDKAGGAVLTDISSGEILAFASVPLFDPSLFSGKMPPEVWKGYLEDKRHPLENKALKGQYPPGSTFKIITALAALEEGIIDASTTVNCSGSYKLGSDTFRCWNKKGHGNVNLKKALRESCDVYFYQTGEKLGIDRISKYARMLGLGQLAGVDLENEKRGNIPDADWKKKKYGKPWYKGETLPVSIGQGYTLATPLQLSLMTAYLASEGNTFKPHLVKKIVDRDGKVVKEFFPEKLQPLSIKHSSWKAVKEGLLAVVNEPGGTGQAARLYEVRVAGKTGTSQVVKQKENQRGAVDYQYRDHALFVAFAPYEKPEVSVAIVIEHGEHGGAAAAPIASRILRKYFETKGVIKVKTSIQSEVDDDTVEADNENIQQKQDDNR